MFRRRPQDDKNPSSSSLPLASDDISIKRRSNLLMFHRCRKGKTRLTLLVLSLLVAILIVNHNKIALLLNDPYYRPIVLNPIRTFWSRFLDNHRPQKVITFHMNQESAFVINLDQDTQRLKTFMARNKNPPVSRFPAYKWHVRPENEDEKEIQYYWAMKYPYIKYAAKIGKYGDAACSLSHVSLWQEKLLDEKGRDYIFVFEDDARLLPPLTSNFIVKAPDVADIVLLPKTASKIVSIPWEGSDNPNPSITSTRAIGGYSTMGYVITKNGAEKMLKALHSSQEPIDLAFYEASNVRVYLPTPWPLVAQSGLKSSRRSFNLIE